MSPAFRLMTRPIHRGSSGITERVSGGDEARPW
jgi:hypothetical protein